MIDFGPPLIQDNPIVEEGTPAFFLDGARLFIRWTQRRSDGALVDCKAQVQLIGVRIVRVRKPKGLPRLHHGKMNMPERES